MRGSGDENDFLLKGYVKQVADHKESKAVYGMLQSHLQEQKACFILIAVAIIVQQ